MKAQQSRQLGAIPFEQAMTTALAVAATSPSSHNCQPWAVARLTGRAPADGHRASEFLVLAADRSREISALSAHRAEMRISCGLYWRLLRRALAAQGWVAYRDVPPLDEPLRDLPSEWNPLRLTEFSWTGQQTEPLSKLRAIAFGRQTNRGPYCARPVSATTLAALDQHLIGTDPPIDIRYLVTESELDRFADYVKRYGGRDFGHRQAWQETHSFLRRDAAEAEARGDGFTLAHLFGSMSPTQHLVRRLVLAPQTMSALRVLGFPRILAGQLARVIRSAPVVAVLSLRESDYLDDDLITAGERLCDYWLHVTRLGLVLHPVSIVVQHDDLRAGLCDRFAVRGRPFFVARLGFPTTNFPRSPRRNPVACFRDL